MATDPIILAAQARGFLESLHKRNDTIVTFKTNQSGYDEDHYDEDDESMAEGGAHNVDRRAITINLDKTLNGKAFPKKLTDIEDWRQYPILAGVAAHHSAHARYSLWDSKENPIPAVIPNPDFEPDFVPTEAEKDPETGEYTGAIVQMYANGHEVPTEFRVDPKGRMYEIASALEQPRVERLGMGTFTKTWRRAMEFSASHLIMESIDEDEENELSPIDSAVQIAIYVGGRLAAGTLGTTSESRKTVNKVLASAQSIIERHVANLDEELRTTDPYHKVMEIVSREVFSNAHDDAVVHLEAARQILKIVHPEEEHDPDGDPERNSGEGEEGDGGGEGSASGGVGGLEDMKRAMEDALSTMSKEMSEMVESDEDWDKDAKGGGGHGSVLYKNPGAPPLARMEAPNQGDRDLYKRALDWFQKQVEPTVTETEIGQWLPVGGARFNVRDHIRDNAAGHSASARSDWERLTETVKTAPPVKVGIMLDGSGSMSAYARPTASIAWAAANAAAMLPESRTASVVYGNAAQLTQAPGREPARQVSVYNTNGSTEDFIGAAKIIEEVLWLDDEIEEDQRSNTLIVIVSDLMYGGAHTHPNGKVERQMEGFIRITEEWANKGIKTLVVGVERDGYLDRYLSDSSYNPKGIPLEKIKQNFSIVSPDELFKD